jgi:hypothetical protein
MISLRCSLSGAKGPYLSQENVPDSNEILTGHPGMATPSRCPSARETAVRFFRPAQVSLGICAPHLPWRAVPRQHRPCRVGAQVSALRMHDLPELLPERRSFTAGLKPRAQLAECACGLQEEPVPTAEILCCRMHDLPALLPEGMPSRRQQCAAGAIPVIAPASSPRVETPAQLAEVLRTGEGSRFPTGLCRLSREFIPGGWRQLRIGNINRETAIHRRFTAFKADE